jgi:hypothetical protein
VSILLRGIVALGFRLVIRNARLGLRDGRVAARGGAAAGGGGLGGVRLGAHRHRRPSPLALQRVRLPDEAARRAEHLHRHLRVPPPHRAVHAPERALTHALLQTDLRERDQSRVLPQRRLRRLRRALGVRFRGAPLFAILLPRGVVADGGVGSRAETFRRARGWLRLLRERQTSRVRTRTRHGVPRGRARRFRSSVPAVARRGDGGFELGEGPKNHAPEKAGGGHADVPRAVHRAEKGHAAAVRADLARGRPRPRQAGAQGRKRRERVAGSGSLARGRRGNDERSPGAPSLVAVGKHEHLHPAAPVPDAEQSVQRRGAHGGSIGRVRAREHLRARPEQSRVADRTRIAFDERRAP